ncbi:MAG: BMFP domain-containing protein YqiC [Myxococcota bacterium]|jgi:BMFP domain-containing protein YqiC
MCPEVVGRERFTSSQRIATRSPAAVKALRAQFVDLEDRQRVAELRRELMTSMRLARQGHASQALAKFHALSAEPVSGDTSFDDLLTRPEQAAVPLFNRRSA